ncbi:hypothetical protein DN752_03265 [Echinicola strongylocentroti]|uniref:Uncharacterized protein n=2 Tax=Echinicola strongylocentroti TaxID=1795355 RepID=A0A2Z4IFG5_9BACT|nr:hypothetical protein DN752_03265 [Echinicola strongylocentroti]
MITFGSFAQADLNTSGLPKENVYLHSAKNFAVVGEAIPLSITITMDQQATVSQFAYADLISRHGKRYGGAVIPLEEGKASAYLTIPQNTPSDHYLLRIYSRYAASLKDEAQYHQELITVVNPNIPPSQPSPQTKNDTQWETPSAANEMMTIAPNDPQIGPGDPSSINLKASPHSKLTLSISRKNPFLDKAKWIKPAPSQKEPSLAHLLPELRGHLIKGTLTEASPDTTKLYFLSAHGKQSALYLGTANPKGEIYFDLGALKNYDFLLLQSDTDSVPFSLNLDLPFAPPSSAAYLDLPPLDISVAQKGMLDDMVLGASTTGYFRKPTQKNLQPIVTGYAPDRGYNLDDYNRFEDLATTLKEYIPTVLVRKKAGKYHFKLTNVPENSVFEGNPLMLVDGMPVFESDQLAHFSPDKFKRAEIINRQFYILSHAFDGILSLISYDNDFGGYPIPDRALYLEYPPIQQPVNWKFDAGKQNDHSPDFRSILLWQEEVQLDENGKATIPFTASQLPGTYEIKVSQITPDGRQIWATKELEVSDQ